MSDFCINFDCTKIGYKCQVLWEFMQGSFVVVAQPSFPGTYLFLIGWFYLCWILIGRGTGALSDVVKVERSLVSVPSVLVDCIVVWVKFHFWEFKICFIDLKCGAFCEDLILAAFRFFFRVRYIVLTFVRWEIWHFCVRETIPVCYMYIYVCAWTSCQHFAMIDLTN